MMKMSPSGVLALRGREGCRLTSYLDSTGVLTIGVGHTGRASGPPVTAGMTITQAQADAMLATDLAPFEVALNSCIKPQITQNQIDACLSLAFNIGVNGFIGSTVVHKINTGDRAGAADAFLMWEKPHVLAQRRIGERAQFLRADGAEKTLTVSVSATVPAVKVVEQPVKKRWSWWPTWLCLACTLALASTHGAPAWAGSPSTVVMDPMGSPNAGLWAWIGINVMPYIDQIVLWLVGIIISAVALKARQWFNVTITASMQEQLRQTGLTGAHLAIQAGEAAADNANLVPNTVSWMKQREPAIIRKLDLKDQVLAAIALKMVSAALSGASAQAITGGSAAVGSPAMARAEGNPGSAN